MTRPVDPSTVEAIIGLPRRLHQHLARVVDRDGDDGVFIMHSKMCVALTPDLRTCPYSLALDLGVADVPGWHDENGEPVRETVQVVLRRGRLMPVPLQ